MSFCPGEVGMFRVLVIAFSLSSLLCGSCGSNGGDSDGSVGEDGVVDLGGTDLGGSDLGGADPGSGERHSGQARIRDSRLRPRCSRLGSPNERGLDHAHARA